MLVTDRTTQIFSPTCAQSHCQANLPGFGSTLPSPVHTCTAYWFRTVINNCFNVGWVNFHGVIFRCRQSNASALTAPLEYWATSLELANTLNYLQGFLLRVYGSVINLTTVLHSRLSHAMCPHKIWTGFFIQVPVMGKQVPLQRGAALKDAGFLHKSTSNCTSSRWQFC